MYKQDPNAPKSEFEEKLLELKRVTKKTTGGSNITFTALMAIGDQKGRVGIGLGRGLEVQQAVKKGVSIAKKNMLTVPLRNATLPHDLRTKFKAAVIILKPAPMGAGLKVGSVVRSILSLAGIQNASGKILGSRNKTTNAYVVMKALSQILVKQSSK